MEKKRETVPLTECIHGSKTTPCNSVCPFELNVRDVLAKMKKGSFIAAFNMYRETVLFPEIACRICPAPCGPKCKETLETDGVDIRALECFLADNFKDKDPINYGVPDNGIKVAVAGSGLAGMAAALKFAQSGYSVTVFEEDCCLCPEISKLLGEEIVQRGVLGQFKFVKCEVKTCFDLSSLPVSDFDHVINASGKTIQGDNVHAVQPYSGLVNGIQAGKNIFRQLDWLVKTGNLRDIEALYADGLADLPEGEEISLDKPSARAMAALCTGCDCSRCMEACEMLKDFGNDIIDLNRAVGVTMNLFEHVDTREGTRQISGCTDCGLCKELCPKGIDIGAFLLDAKKQLYRQGVIPHAYHDYWLRDYAFAESDSAFLYYEPAPGKSEYLFFPGCQTGASDPRYVTMSYELLLREHPDCALLLGCCGAPVKWTGDDEGTEKAHEEIKEYWEKAGRPVIVTVCPSCYKILKESLREAQIVMLYELVKEPSAAQLPFEKASVFDPCSSRYEPQLQSKVREFAKKAGLSLEESLYAGKESQCCSFGQQVYNVNRNMVEKQVKERMKDSELPYVVYCTNCRDIFASRGKEVRHILDLILGINKEERPVPTLQERRTNRYMLKKELIEKYSINAKQSSLPSVLDLRFDDKLQKKMDDDLILSEDISDLIRLAEESSLYLVDSENGHRIAHLYKGIMTYWAEYLPEEDGYRVFNIYSHRVNIKNDTSKMQ
ncbi:MAG: 4Fe-4S dicluster domain-containing protein [Firmicutes bacterium]|nr:4Fe-4S dicluster domain-containing protein [Bacillota bacterium]